MEPSVSSPLVELRDERVERHGIRVWLTRDDLVHPGMPGNKWRKLKFNLADARSWTRRSGAFNTTVSEP
ncbi:hypothetical protein [Amycolatopsis pigmentata]|uniref:Uncharacterized protein n=1 Tax=Amycolatopsis pigmentata TaxID=450801 RepID=A0ABW5FPB0_9PSEU